MSCRKSLIMGALAAAFVLPAAKQARAADCSTLNTNIVYVAGSSAVEPLIAKIDLALEADSSTTTVVYQNQGSCTGVNAITQGTKITGTALYFNAANPDGLDCTLDAAGQTVDIGVSDVFAESCGATSTDLQGVKDFFGPADAMLFVAPKASSAQGITAEEGYFTFGFGGADGMASPWLSQATSTCGDQPCLQFIRNTSSGTQQMTSRAVAVPADKMRGVDGMGSSGVAAKVAASTDPDPTIGILGAADYDSRRDSLKALAFQTFGQYVGYFADSTSTSFDKQNVRDGHYVIWGPVHMLAKVDGSGNPSAGAQLFIDSAQGTSSSVIDAVVGAHMVPMCAMHVTRTEEMGDLSLYYPKPSCDCYFDKSNNGSTSCTTCSSDTDCASGSETCLNGYCEATNAGK